MESEAFSYHGRGIYHGRGNYHGRGMPSMSSLSRDGRVRRSPEIKGNDEDGGNLTTLWHADWLHQVSSKFLTRSAF